MNAKPLTALMLSTLAAVVNDRAVTPAEARPLVARGIVEIAGEHTAPDGRTFLTCKVAPAYTLSETGYLARTVPSLSDLPAEERAKLDEAMAVSPLDCVGISSPRVLRARLASAEEALRIAEQATGEDFGWRRSKLDEGIAALTYLPA